MNHAVAQIKAISHSACSTLRIVSDIKLFTKHRSVCTMVLASRILPTSTSANAFSSTFDPIDSSTSPDKAASPSDPSLTTRRRLLSTSSSVARLKSDKSTAGRNASLHPSSVGAPHFAALHTTSSDADFVEESSKPPGTRFVEPDQISYDDTKRFDAIDARRRRTHTER